MSAEIRLMLAKIQKCKGIAERRIGNAVQDEVRAFLAETGIAPQGVAIGICTRSNPQGIPDLVAVVDVKLEVELKL